MTIRTAQRWEAERGLPVSRLPGPRGSVRCSVAALLAWQQTTDVRETVTEPTPLPPDATPLLAGPEQTSAATLPVTAPVSFPQRWVRRRWSLAALLAVLGLVGAGCWLYAGGRRVPDQWRMEHNTLVVTDDHGRELWRKTIPLQLVDYRLEADHTLSVFGWIGDLDGDGRNEVVVGLLQQPGSMRESDAVVCYSDRGVERWRFTPGVAAQRFREDLRPPYRVLHVSVARLGKANDWHVIVASVQHTWYASQIALVSKDGSLEREYWHSGHLFHITTGDLDGTGSNLLFAGGIANGYKAAALVALDPDHFGGVSREEDERYQLPGPPGVEVARVLFPRSCLNRHGFAYNGVMGLWMRNGLLETTLDEEPGGHRAAIAYTFGRGLSLRSLGVSDGFVGRHQALSPALGHNWSTAEERPLNDITYLKRPAGTTVAAR